MKVKKILDCGCAITEDGARHWCPSCSAPIPTRSHQELEKVRTRLRNRLASWENTLKNGDQLDRARAGAAINEIEGFLFMLDKVDAG